MAKTDLEQLVVQLSADVKGYENALAKAQNTTVRELKRMESAAERSTGYIGKKFDEIGNDISSKFTGIGLIAVAAIEEIARSAVKEAANIGKLGDKLGENTDLLQGLTYGAVQADVSFEELSGGLLKFSKNIGLAANHQGDLYKVLKLNNIAINDASGKQRPFNDLLNDFADLVKNAKNEQEALALVMIGFGKGSDGFLDFLKNGSSGLKGFQQDAKDAGAVIDHELIEKAQKLDDRWAALMQSMKAHTESFVLSVIDGFSQIGQAAPSTQKYLPGGKGLPGSLNPAYVAANPQLGPNGTPTTPAQAALSGAVRGNLTDIYAKPTVLPDPEAEAAAKRAAELYKQQQKAIQGVIDALSLEYDNLGRSKEQQAEYNEIKKAGTGLDAKQRQTIIAKVQAIELEKQKMETAAQAEALLQEKQKAFYEGLSYLASTGADDFGDLITGAKSLNNVLGDTLALLTKAALQSALLGQGPLAGLFGTQAAGGGLGGLFGSLLSSFNPSTPASIYHLGGTAGSGSMSRRVPLSLFNGAPRYHAGGIAGNEVPAILQKGEKILRAGQSSGGNVVQIIDQRTNAPPIEKQQDSNGQVRFLVRDEVRRTINSGEADKALGGRFGARPVKTRHG